MFSCILRLELLVLSLSPAVALSLLGSHHRLQLCEKSLKDKVCQRRAAFSGASTEQEGTGECRLREGQLGTGPESPPSPQTRCPLLPISSPLLGRHPEAGHSPIACKERDLTGALSPLGWEGPRFGFNPISTLEVLNSPPAKGERANLRRKSTCFFFFPKQLPALTLKQDNSD